MVPILPSTPPSKTPLFCLAGCDQGGSPWLKWASYPFQPFPKLSRTTHAPGYKEKGKGYPTLVIPFPPLNSFQQHSAYMSEIGGSPSIPLPVHAAG